MSKINVKIWGVQGKDPKARNNRAAVNIEVDDGYQIGVDAFKGSGRTYERRNHSDVVIINGDKTMFSGSIEKLCQVLEDRESHDKIREGFVGMEDDVC